MKDTVIVKTEMVKITAISNTGIEQIHVAIESDSDTDGLLELSGAVLSALSDSLSARLGKEGYSANAEDLVDSIAVLARECLNGRIEKEAVKQEYIHAPVPKKEYRLS